MIAVKYNVKHISKTKSNPELQAVIFMMKINKIKKVDQRLRVVKLHLQGMSNSDIARVTEYTRSGVGVILKRYKEQGLAEFAKHKYGGNSQALSYEEEAAILAPFIERATKGELVTAAEIKKVFDSIRDKDTGRGYIYMLLNRHGWGKKMPRPAHPKKAAEEAISSSKKLT